MFGKNKNIKSGAKTLDKLITGLVLGSTIAGVYGLSKTNKGKELTKELKTKVALGEKLGQKVSKKVWKGFGKSVIFVVSLFSKKK